MTLGRPIEFDRDATLARALECFWTHGYEATSMQDLLSFTGLSKSSLYQAYGSKRDLFERCLTRYRNEAVASLEARLKRSKSGLAFIRRTLEAAAIEARTTPSPKGCFVMNTATEFAQNDKRIAQLVAAGFNEFAAVFRSAVVRAQREGDIAPEADPTALAGFLVANMSGLRTLAKAGTDPKILLKSVRIALAAL